MTKLEAGESLTEIRAYIDQAYRQFGPATDTKMP
ncbi:MAG: PCYCGC domain-containing protein [Chloroflexi bacterium]|nr:PCYCGC domain-containing protein [Chloroflexota bacterium]